MQLTAGPGQLRFYLLRAQGADTTLVHHLVVDGAVDSGRLLGALAEVVRTQPALRTSVHQVGGAVVQRLHPPETVPIAVRAAGDADVAAEIDRVRADIGAAGPWCAISALVGPRRTDCVVAVDHANFDELSAGILLRCVADAYARAGTAQIAVVGPAGFRGVPSERDGALRRFWHTALDGCPDDTFVPQVASTTDRRRAGLSRVLDAGLTTAVTERMRRSGATPFAQMLAALAVTVGWYTDRDDVVLATVASIRDDHDAGVIGCLQNTLPIRVRIDGADTDGVIDRTVDALYDAIEHAGLPIEDIVAVRGATRVAGRKPLTQIIAVQATAAEPVTDPQGLRWHLETAAGTNVGYDLAVTLDVTAGETAVRLDYPAAALTASAVEAFAEHLLRAMAVLAAPQPRPLAELSLLDAGEAVLRTPPVTAPGFLERFASAVRRRQDTIAVDDGTSGLSYADLDRRAGELAGALAAAGVHAGDRVGICLPRTVDTVVSMIAVWRCAAAYVPLDPQYPHDRLRYMAGDAALAAVITQSDIVAGFPVVPPDARGPAVTRTPAPAGPAYVIYTSGSTGTPKGVVSRHDNVAMLLAAFDALLPDAPASVVAATSLSFDISVLELCWPLATGRTVVLTGHRTVTTATVPDGVLYQCTPTVARLLADDPDGRRLLGRLGVLLVGGEPLPEDLAATLVGLVPGPVINCYGPTETTVWSTVWRVRPDDGVRIGTPLAGETCWVADAHGRVLPPGSPGRLMIAGAGVGDGYWNRPELTTERFRPGPAGVAYDTGDLAVLDQGGELRCLGRADSQIKLMGQRIELEEIEIEIRRAPRVSDAAVAVSRGVLVAFVADGHAPAGPVEQVEAQFADHLRRHAARWLTATMVPAVWARIAHIPQLPNGKRDRVALARLSEQLDESRATTSAPAGPATQVVIDAWAQVLGTPVTTADATFFELGGSSADLVRVLAALQPQVPGLTVGDLFRYTTARALADHLAGLSAPPGSDGDGPPDTDRTAARRRALSRWRPRTGAKKGTAQ